MGCAPSSDTGTEYASLGHHGSRHVSRNPKTPTDTQLYGNNHNKRHSVTVGGGISSCRSFLFLYFFSFSSSLLEDEDEDDDDFLLLLWLLPYSCVSVGVLGFLLTCLLPW
jgi:hypothetical protein